MSDEAMYPQPNRRVSSMSEGTMHTATCPSCRWYVDGETGHEAWLAGERHALDTGHVVRVRSVTITALSRRVAT